VVVKISKDYLTVLVTVEIVIPVEQVVPVVLPVMVVPVQLVIKELIGYKKFRRTKYSFLN
jgi:hypothetical protein